MKEETFRGRRRVGAALLAGVTALGAAGVAVLASGGVAAAATPTVTTTAATTTIAGTSTDNTAAKYAQNGGSITLNVNGSVGTNDEMQVILACQSGAIQFTGTPSATVNGSATNWTTTLSSNGTCGTSVDNVITMKYTGATSLTSPSVVLGSVQYITTGATSGAVSLSGVYVPAAAASVNFSVASDATVSAIATTSNLPAITLASGTTNQVISNVTFNEPAGFPGNFALTGTAGALTLTINSNKPGTATGTVAPNATFGTGTVNWSQSNGGSTSSGTATVVAGSSSSYGSVSLTPTAASTGTNATITISGLALSYLGSGPVTADVTYTAANPSGASPAVANTIDLGNITLASAIGSSNRIQGSDGTADGTVAEEFLSAFPNGNTNVVLATDVDPYDALSAAYLEKALGTGLLITSPTSLNANAITAMRIAGVKNVYVVGGVDAVSQNVISQIEALPAYNEGGFTTTGSNVTVVQRLSGATADATAQQIATFAGSVPGSMNIAGAYSAASGTNGGGVYNDTSGSASATGPAGAVPTAFVIANTDWQDATTLSPIAYYDRIPILLTPAGSLGQEASSALTSLGIKQAVVVGGNLALSNNVVSSIQALNGGISVLRIAGYDYTETATQLAKFELATGSAGLNWSPTGILVARGNYWSDALGGAAMAATGQIGSTNYGAMPIVTTENQTTIGTYLQSFLTSEAGSSISTVNVLGGPLAVTPSVVTQIQTTLAS